MSSTSFDYLLKLIVIGDSGVGKSCVVTQFIEKRIQEDHDVTIGVQFAARTVEIGGNKIKLQIWDTAGQQNFRSITRSYYRNAIGALLIYDISRDTFQHVKVWLAEATNNSSGCLEVILVGNKNDLQEQRKITYEQGKELAEKQKLQFIQINARNYSVVEKAFQCVISRIIDKVNKGQISLDAPGIKISEEKKLKLLKNEKKRCC